jgi:hypothetical protein
MCSSMWIHLSFVSTVLLVTAQNFDVKDTSNFNS